MALWRSIGAVQTIAPGRTQVWHITYPNGRDVGVVVAAPNPSETNVELVAFDQGVFVRPVGEELSTHTQYTVKIRNAGTAGIGYNLNIGDWQTEGAQAPTAARVKQLPPGVSDVVVQPTVAVARRAKKKAARKRKAARRR
jgi:hypothetical protein